MPDEECQVNAVAQTSLQLSELKMEVVYNMYWTLLIFCLRMYNYMTSDNIYNINIHTQDICIFEHHHTFFLIT